MDHSRCSRKQRATRRKSGCQHDQSVSAAILPQGSLARWLPLHAGENHRGFVAFEMLTGDTFVIPEPEGTLSGKAGIGRAHSGISHGGADSGPHKAEAGDGLAAIEMRNRWLRHAGNLGRELQHAAEFALRLSLRWLQYRFHRLQGNH